MNQVSQVLLYAHLKRSEQHELTCTDRRDPQIPEPGVEPGTNKRDPQIPEPGVEPGCVSPALQADSLPSEPPGKPVKMKVKGSRSVVSDSSRPHGLQPTRLLRPWDSPGKNTGVGCHFLLQRMRVKSESESEVVSDSVQPHGLQPTRLLHPWDFPGKSTGVGCH